MINMIIDKKCCARTPKTLSITLKMNKHDLYSCGWAYPFPVMLHHTAHMFPILWGCSLTYIK